ncbi:MAG: heavy metal-associated domain-containing protein [Dehalococcoidia bacterium]|nr:heavy metal-associated domain-containing protein [Dehalococcoidia bacterium]
MQRALEGLPGVTSARVDLETGAATVEGWGDASEEGAMRAVQGTVLLHRLRGILSRVPLLGLPAGRQGRRPW